MATKSKITLAPVDTFNTEAQDGSIQGSHIEFVVVQLTDSVEYDIDQRLRREIVRQLCEDEDWTVTVKKAV